MADVSVPEVTISAGLGALGMWFFRRLMGDDVREEQRKVSERLARMEARMESWESQLNRIERRLSAAERE